MKIIMFNPPYKGMLYSRASRSPSVTKSGSIYYPLWLALATGVLEEAGHEVKLIDAPAERKRMVELIGEIGMFEPGLIVVNTSTPSIKNDLYIARMLKKQNKGAFVVLVGTHASIMKPEEIHGFDAVCIGEYDYTLRDFAAALEKKEMFYGVKGLMSKTIRTEVRPLIEDLDKIPFASKVYKEHLNYRNYFFSPAQYPVIQIISGRGCPNMCTFCVYPQVFHGRKYRPRSPENLVDEFEYIKRYFPNVREIGIEDDTFTVDKKRVKKFCKLLIKRNLQARWYTNVRADLDLDTMQWMKKAGCRLVTVGFESGDDEILKNIKKGITVKQIKKFAADAKKARILVHGAWMVGNIGETKETLEKTLELAKQLNTDMAQFLPIMLYPGTEMYEWAKANHYLTTENYSKWVDENGEYNCIMTTPTLKKRDIYDFCNRATREYYLRPKYLLMKIGQVITHPGEIYRNFKAGFEVVKRMFK